MSALLQPVAHALLQAREEINELMNGFDDDKLWVRPAGLASAGFHLQHLAGILSRLFKYAKGEQLNAQQLEALAMEGEPYGENCNSKGLVRVFNSQVDACMVQLYESGILDLASAREVGRAKLPSTVIGLYVHAAEHTMRHVGQLLVTVKFLQAST
jgi:hypothetical protein